MITPTLAYTHRINYTEYRPILEMSVKTYFNTTADVVDLHVRNLSRSKNVSDIKVEVL
jgi:hypothetical protein